MLPKSLAKSTSIPDLLSTILTFYLTIFSSLNNCWSKRALSIHYCLHNQLYNIETVKLYLCSTIICNLYMPETVVLWIQFILTWIRILRSTFGYSGSGSNFRESWIQILGSIFGNSASGSGLRSDPDTYFFIIIFFLFPEINNLHFITLWFILMYRYSNRHIKMKLFEYDPYRVK